MTQEVFLRVIRREEAVPVGNLDGYIFQIAANLLRDGARRAVTRHARLHIDYESGLDGADDEEMVDILDPHRIAEARDTLSHSLRALSELGERTRDIFVLSRVEKLKHKEIAEMLGVSVSAVEKHLVKAFTHIALCKRSLRG